MKKIGKYIVCGLLGKGGMGSVYKVRPSDGSGMVALKLLSPHPHMVGLLGYQEIRDRFIAEARMIASLHNPHVIEILDFDFDAENPFYTMEYHYLDLGSIIGENYQADFPSRILSLDKTIRYTRQILLGLVRIFQAGIVHRDIKPGNLLISEEDLIKICDFGFSRIRGERRPVHSPYLIVGSPFYAAPEQEQNPDLADHRADLYSTGVIVHRMLTGLLPEGGVLKPSKYHPDADPGWDSFVEKALRQDPERRFHTPSEMLHEMERLSLAWEKKKENFCRVIDKPRAGEAERAGHGRKLRSIPLKTDLRSAPDVFASDRLLRPAGYSDGGFSYLFEGESVFNAKSGLVWQKSGSDGTLSWTDAHGYVEGLNARRYCGGSRWRLPTVDELFSILKSPQWGVQDCLDPAFDSSHRLLWSSDRCTFVSAWYVHAELGFAGIADFTCLFHVRAVMEYENFPASIQET